MAVVVVVVVVWWRRSHVACGTARGGGAGGGQYSACKHQDKYQADHAQEDDPFERPPALL